MFRIPEMELMPNLHNLLCDLQTIDSIYHDRLKQCELQYFYSSHIIIL